MKSLFWTIYRDDKGQGSAEGALVAALIALLIATCPKLLIPQKIPFAVSLVVSPNGSLSGTVDAILQIAEERSRLLHQLRTALLEGNNTNALKLARLYCGILRNNHEKESGSRNQG